MPIKVIRYMMVSLGMLILIDISSRSQEVSKTIVFEERVHNFGTILEEKGKVTHTFVFQNTGTEPVVINEIASGCGCIGKAHSKNPVPPGGKGKVTITFDPEYKSGFFSKEIFIFSNKSQMYNHVWVEGTIIPAEHPIEVNYPYNFGEGLHLRLKVMAFGYFKPGESKMMELHYANETDKEMNLNFKVDGNSQGLTFQNPGKIKPKARGVMNVYYMAPLFGQYDDVIRLHPYVNNKILAETLDIKVLKENKKGL